MNCASNPKCGECAQCIAEERVESLREAFLLEAMGKLGLKGKSPERALKVAERALRIEIHRELRWD